MYANEDRTEWHLTSRGWVRGTWSAHGADWGTEEAETPEDRVATWVYSMFQGHSLAKTKTSVSRRWRSGRQREARLLEEFGPCPRSL